MLKDLWGSARDLCQTHTKRGRKDLRHLGAATRKDSFSFPLSVLSILAVLLRFFALTLGIIIAFGNCMAAGEIDSITKTPLITLFRMPQYK